MTFEEMIKLEPKPGILKEKAMAFMDNPLGEY